MMHKFPELPFGIDIGRRTVIWRIPCRAGMTSSWVWGRTWQVLMLDCPISQVFKQLYHSIHRCTLNVFVKSGDKWWPSGWFDILWLYVLGELSESQKQDMEKHKEKLVQREREIEGLRLQMAKLSKIIDKQKDEIKTLQKQLRWDFIWYVFWSHDLLLFFPSIIFCSKIQLENIFKFSLKMICKRNIVWIPRLLHPRDYKWDQICQNCITKFQKFSSLQISW